MTAATAWSPRALFALLLLCSLVLLSATPLQAVIKPRDEAMTVAHPDLVIANSHRPAHELPALAPQLRAELAALGVDDRQAFYDVRGARWGTLVISRPLVPGPGIGNTLSWARLREAPPANDEDYKAAVWRALRRFLALQPQLGIDAAELPANPRIALHDDRRLVQIHASREMAGVPVRDSFLKAVVNSGNLVLLGTHNWGAIDASTRPSLSKEDAQGVVEAHLQGFVVERYAGRAHLILVPLANGSEPSEAAVGQGYRYRLAWVLHPVVEGSQAGWEALVDAHDAELLLFADQNQYAIRRAFGGIFPVSNDGQSPGGVPDGLEQPAHPMPFATLTRPDGSTVTTNSAGLASFDGPFSMDLTGPFVRIADNCGFVQESTSCNDLDLGVSGGTDCTVPAGHSAGDTHSARTGFYEINRIIEQAKGWVDPNPLLPPRPWLNSQITSNMNINNACNAFFSPVDGTINFYRENAQCRNTGEIAAVFDHEWGHGLDFNDATPGITRPGEAYADIAALLRLNTSCIGRGFFKLQTCPGNGDACTVCTGVRDLDWKNRVSGAPHGIAFVKSNCGALNPNPLQTGPCSQGTHCEGTIVGEAYWDLITRDLRCHGPRWQDVAGPVGGGRCTGGVSPTIGYNTSLEHVTRLYYQAAGGVSHWYQCVPNPAPYNAAADNGCNAGSGYLQSLAADDNDGTFANGTPHMQAIFDAFNRHQIACPAIPVVNNNAACTSQPTSAPSVSATATVNGANVAWNAVAGAIQYWVFRTEGVHGCNFGKERIATVTGTSFSETGLKDGRQYFYSVIPVGGAGATPNDSCSGPMSACRAVTPLAPPGGAGPALTVAGVPGGLSVLTGDADEFLDNCENANLAFSVTNSGGVTLTNVRLRAVRPVSHPSTQVHTPLPVLLASSLPSGCGSPAATVQGSFNFTAHGLAHNDTLRFEVDVTANQLPGPVTGILEVFGTETDLTMGDVTFDFETGTQGWTTFSGTFNRTNVPPPGANGTDFYMKSSSAQDNACDRARSPELRLTGTSTLSLYNQFVTEAGTPATPFYDRGNVGIVNETGQLTPIAPDGGRLYNATDPYTGCNNSDGWATHIPDQPVNLWDPSTWSSTALQAASFAGQKVRLDVAYGSDALTSLDGLQFDEVELTDVMVTGPDQQSDVCTPPSIDARDDSATTVKNRPVRINVVANDTTNNPPLTVTSVTDPPQGTATNNNDGTVTYRPDLHFVGTDTFQYTVCDNAGLCDTARVTVTVRPLRQDDDDDDDHDDDGERDDEDEDDDGDGQDDDADNDDDNDGDSDSSDNDDDNDSINDEFDSESTQELQQTQPGVVASGQPNDYLLTADSSTLLIIASVASAQAELLTVEIYDPAGALVARSLPTPLRALATAPTLSPGSYTVRVLNNGAPAISYTATLIQRTLWF